MYINIKLNDMTETINYINKETGEEKIVTRFSSKQAERSFCTVRTSGKGDLRTFKTLEETEDFLTKNGCVRKGFRDKSGIIRHSLSRGDLVMIDRGLDKLITDITTEEFESCKGAFLLIKGLIDKLKKE